MTYEYANLNGDDYNPYPYAFSDSSSLPGYRPAFTNGDNPFTLDQLRKYDVADRTEHVIKAQTNFILSEKLDFQLTGDFKSDRYNADYGLRKAEGFDFNAELNYQLSVNTTLNAYYSYQARYRNDANIRSGTVIASSAAGSSSYPFANGWTESTDDRSRVFGIGAHHKFDSVTIDMNYTYVPIGYAYASPTAFAAQLNTAQVGTAFPNTTFDDQVFETSVLWNYTAKLGIRGYYRLEHEKLDDFHYTGLTNVILNNIYLGAIPQNYTAHVIGLFFQYSY